ncbi:MAG: helix-turn-helix transcriptional regulator [Saprospiraceae bacterium]
MRKTAKIPRIIKLHEISGFKIYCAFNTGEHRIINFESLFRQLGFKSDDPIRSQLFEEKTFKEVQLHEGTLQWPNIKQKLKLSNGLEFEVMFDLDPIVLYDSSELDEARNEKNQIGQVLKKARIEAGLTQEELAKRSGTTKNYISRIENNKSDIELGTLRKIIEIGLDKRLNIKVS